MAEKRGAERRRRLARVAVPLEPDVAPYYVSSERRQAPAHPTPGWYWRPKGWSGPEYLGYSSVDAEIALRGKVEAAGIDVAVPL
jgi:hypothetical protein